MKGKSCKRHRVRSGARARPRATKHPEIVKQLRDHYETWWAGRAAVVRLQPGEHLRGTQENPVTLCSADWANVYCDNMNDLRTGKRINGPVGTFWSNMPASMRSSFAAGRARADAAVTAACRGSRRRTASCSRANRCRLSRKIDLAIATALDETKPVSADDKGITFTAKLPPAKHDDAVVCLDEKGKPICGAYFAYVRRIEKVIRVESSRHCRRCRCPLHLLRLPAHSAVHATLPVVTMMTVISQSVGAWFPRLRPSRGSPVTCVSASLRSCSSPACLSRW